MALRYFLVIFFLLFIFASCSNHSDEELFNGEIRYIDDSRVPTKDVTAKHVSLEGDYAGVIAVHDSLLVCWEPSYENYLFAAFNVDTGKEIGYFCPKGQGPGEFNNVNLINQFFKKDGNLMTLLNGDAKSLAFWNITRSVQTGETVYDTIIPYRWQVGQFFFYLPHDTLLSVMSTQYTDIHESSTPYCEKRHIHAEEAVKFPIYKLESVRNDGAKEPVGDFFYTWSTMKPDGTHIVQAMRKLPQLNMIDTRTGQVIGYRIKGGPDYSLVQTTMSNLTEYYYNVQADDKYIYAVYWGKESWDGSLESSLPKFDMIHVFDWEGNLLYKLRPDQSFYITWLDTARNRLYTRDWNTDEIYYLDLNELGL